MAAVPGGCARPHPPLRLAPGPFSQETLRGTSVGALARSMENFLKKPSGREAKFWKSDQSPALAAHPRLSFANISRCLFVLRCMVIKSAQTRGQACTRDYHGGLQPLFADLGCYNTCELK